MRLKLICSLGMLIFSGNLWALTLENSISNALQHEDQLQLNSLMVAQKQAIVQQTKRSYGMSVNLVGQLGYEQVVTHNRTMFPAEGARTLRGLELQFDYPIYTWGRHQLAVQSAQLQHSAQEQALSGQRAKTILQAVRVYTDVLKQQALLALQAKTNENLKRSLFEAEKRFAAGVITRADLSQVKAQYAQGQADLVTAQSNLKVSQANFILVIGLEADNLQPINVLPIISDSLADNLLHVYQHPMVKQAQLELSAVQRQYELVRKELQPTINLTSRIGTQHDLTTINSQSENYMVGLQFNIPLYDNGVNKTNVEKTAVDRELAQHQLTILQQNLTREIRQSYAQLGAVQENKQALREAIQSASIALEYVNKELEVGTKTTFDSLTAQQKLLELETQQVMNEQDEVVLAYQLLDQTGRIEAFVSNILE